MFQNCSYHVLDSLMPPSPDVDKSIQQSLIRLENICAVSIVKDGRNNKTLSQIPAHLHKVIWRAYLTDKYYAYDFSFDELPELLYHWPYEEFILKDLMSSLPPRLDDFADMSLDPYDENKEKLEGFYSYIIDTIIRTFTEGFSDSSSEQRESYCKIRNINISGYKTNMNEIKEMIEIKEPFLRNSSCRLEITLDVRISGYDTFYHGIEAGTNMLTTHTYSNSFNTIVLKFNHITVYANDGEGDVVTGFIEGLLANGPISIELSGSGYIDCPDILEQVLTNNIPQGNILAVKLYKCTFSMTSLQHLNSLVHLDIQECNLHGKLNYLRHMHRGLLYLKLRDCRLTNSDLGQLLGTCHQLTLLELNLGYNSFEHDESCTNLIELCKNFANILHLDLHCCGLETWPSNGIKLFFHFIKSMQNIIYLNLRVPDGPEYSVCSFTNHIMILKESLSLRYLSLMFTGEECITESDAKLFCAEVNGMINENRSQLFYVGFDYPFERNFNVE